MEAKPKPKTKRAKPKPKPQLIPVKLVSHQGESALVEWYNGQYQRAYIPLSEYDFTHKTVPDNVLTAGIPYGVDWSQMDLTIDPAALDHELKKRGIWTREDLEQKPNQAIAAINQISGMMRRQMLTVADKGGK